MNIKYIKRKISLARIIISGNNIFGQQSYKLVSIDRLRILRDSSSGMESHETLWLSFPRVEHGFRDTEVACAPVP